MTAFETQVEKLGLINRDPSPYWVSCKELKNWCREHMYTHYVPEYLLNVWGLYVDPQDERLYCA